MIKLIVDITFSAQVSKYLAQPQADPQLELWINQRKSILGCIAALNKAKTCPAYAGLAQLSLILSEHIGGTENCMHQTTLTSKL